jgi:hypothetical protein
METYRVFVDRYYIAVTYFDVKAKNSRCAKNAARKAAYHIKPNPIEEATDNGWIPEEPVFIPKLGHSEVPFKVKKIMRTKNAIVYQDKNAL